MTEEYERYKAAQAARWLEHVAKLRRKIASLKDEIDEARAMADGVQLSAETAAAAWNRRAERTYHPERISTAYHSAIVCSECKHRLDEVTIYCPNCGARLEGVGR